MMQTWRNFHRTCKNKFAMLRNYFLIATRILARNKLYAVINVLGLAIGVCGSAGPWPTRLRA